ncbi:hypothetical protein GC163_12640 [bacterium]|nr:hypothetical protein [bacterium]
MQTTEFFPGDATLTRRIKKHCHEHQLHFKEYGHWQRYGRLGRKYKVDKYVADAAVVRREIACREQEIIQQQRQRNEERQRRAEQWIQENAEMVRFFQELDRELNRKLERPKKDHTYLDWRQFGF